MEDDAGLRALSEEMLQHLGYMVVSAGTPAEALNVAQQLQVRIDLVISDVILPGMNGGELVKELLKIRPTLKVLFVSGYTDNVIHDALSAGAAFLQKPVSRDALAKKVREVLGSSGEGANLRSLRDVSAGGLV